MIRNELSTNTVAMSVLFNRFFMSLFACDTSSIFCCNSELTVISSSFSDCSSSFEVVSSSFVLCSSSFVDCSSSLVDFNSSCDVSISSTVVCNCSLVYFSSRSSSETALWCLPVSFTRRAAGFSVVFSSNDTGHPVHIGTPADRPHDDPDLLRPSVDLYAQCLPHHLAPLMQRFANQAAQLE